jgi:hypothetical protein
MSLTWTYTAPEGAATAITVTYDTGEWTHVRDVNAVFTANGEYDADATEIRVGEVALGVENKIISGAIVERTEDPAENTP